ncbi:hypothetical protein C0Q70_11104 [Pomacea canaliculata]|uniref:Uncharacterized protein n=1 Tax=Pomacea canaliculata TaxID=400727 RepID=A0A2T7P539_POMCA|nr:hypothetical protein C0Q70_11104 [Pomacea canaliculata]
MAAVLVFAVLVLFTPTDIYMTQESDKCSRIDLTSCSNHHLRCPNEGPPSVIALSQAKNGFRRSAVFSFCSYQFSCAAQSTCCVRSYFRFCYEDVSDDHLMDLAYACLIESSCEFRVPVVQANSSNCRSPAFDSDQSLMSTIQSRNWYVRIEDSKKSVVVFSPFHNRTEVLAKKRMSGLLTPVTIHLRVENAGAPSLLWIGLPQHNISDCRSCSGCHLGGSASCSSSLHRLQVRPSHDEDDDEVVDVAIEIVI